MARKNKIDIKRLGWALSLTIALFYVFDFILGFTLSVEIQELYLELLSLAYFGFTGFDIGSFLLGLVQSFIWGWVIAWVFGSIWNKVSGK